MQATAAVLHQPNGPFAIEAVDVAEPGPGEVRVAIKAVGICHTDLVVASGAMGLTFPAVLGHEGAGVIESLGEGIGDLTEGDKVLLSFNSCGECGPCHDHAPAYCHQFMPLNMLAQRPDGSSRIHVSGTPASDNFFGQSSFASLAIANRRNVVRLAPDADLAALAPLGCGVQTGVGAVLRSLNARPGESLVVLGAGAVGLSAVLGGGLAHCGPIVVVEPQTGRRELAIELGATHVLDGSGDVAAQVRAILPAGADIIVDTSGFVPVVQQSVNMIANRGRLGLVGVPGSLDAALQVPVLPWLAQGATVRGIVEGDSDPATFLPELIAHHRAGHLPIERFCRTYPLREINQAIADAHSGQAVKAVLLID